MPKNITLKEKTNKFAKKNPSLEAKTFVAGLCQM